MFKNPFTTSTGVCHGVANRNLYMEMCNKHLAQFFGLEMEFIEHDDKTEVTYVGAFLRPARNVVFPSNTVIVPTRDFLDWTIQPANYPADRRTSPAFQSLGTYELNPVIQEFIRQTSHNKGEMDKYKRLCIEVLRNWTADGDVTTGPRENQSYMLKNLITEVTASLSLCKTTIRTQTIYDVFPNFSLMCKGANDSVEMKRLTEVVMSDLMRYFIVNCYHSTHNTKFNRSVLHDYVFPNCMWVEDVGLVTLEKVARPNFLIVYGNSDGDQIYYNRFVNTVAKKTSTEKITEKDILPPYFMENAFRGGSDKCLM